MSPPLRLTTPRRRWSCARFALCLLCMSGATRPALAQQEDESDEPDYSADFSPSNVRIRWSETFRELGRGASAPTLYIHDDALSKTWKATVAQSDRGKLQELSSITLPTWFGQPYYDYKVEILPTGRSNQFYALLVATPIPSREAPPASSTMELAWLVDRPARGTTRWKYIAKTYRSELDGGDLLVLRKNAAGVGELLRFRDRIAKRFCGDSQASTTQIERYTPEKRIFTTEIDVDALEREATALQAILPQNTFIDEDLYGYTRWTMATSDLRTPTDSNTILRPLELGDRDLATVWSEGAPKEGRGEFVTASISVALPLKGFRIYPGDGASAEAWAHAPRPKTVLVGLSNGTRYRVELPPSSHDDLEDKGGLLVEFPSPQSTDCLSVLLLDAYPPVERVKPRSAFAHKREFEAATAHAEAVAISELTPISVLEGSSARSTAQQTLTRFQEERDERRRQNLLLMTRNNSSYLLEELRQRLTKSPPEISIKDAANVLNYLPSSDAIPLLMELLEKTPPEGDDWRALRRATAAHHIDTATPLWQVIQRIPPEQTRRRVDLVRLFGRVAPPEQLVELIEGLGRGEQRERNERIRALANGEILVVPALLTFAEAHLSDEAGEDALKTIEVISRREQDTHAISDTLGARMIALTERAERRRAKLRLIHILAAYRPSGSESFMARELLLGSQDTHVRRAAAEALARYEQDLSGEALREALVDPSPDVRIAAIKSLMARPDRARIAQDVIRYIERERWTEGLRPAIAYLAQLDDPTIDAKLSGWILDTTVPQRAYLSAQAFERVRRAPSIEVITPHLFEPQTSFQMRRQLVELLAWEQSEAGEQLLIDILSKGPFNALEPPRAIEALETRAMLALGVRRSEAALPVLLRIVAESSDLSHRKSALRALSFHADQGVIDELNALKRDAPLELQESFDDTISLVQRRLDLVEAQDSVKEIEARERERQIKIEELRNTSQSGAEEEDTPRQGEFNEIE